jgi:hypothetical protein
MRVGIWISAAAILMISSSGAAEPALGSDNRAGLWENQVHSNMGLFVSRDFITGKLSARQMKQMSDQMMTQPGGTRRICGTQAQAQHPRLLAGVAVNCSTGSVTISGRTALFDGTCHETSKYHMAVEFDTPTHVVVTLTEAQPKPGIPALVTKHDLHWLSADCGDLKPGQMREIAAPAFLKRP